MPNKLISSTLRQGARKMAIFYMDVKIIGRSSGRSAIGAAAYRRSAKMHSIAHAAYQRGEKIIGIGDKVTHDYRSKGGVVYSKIMLPDDAPPEFIDAQTLWNAVEASETRKNAQLAREIIVALPKEFNLSEQKVVLRQYIKENFVSKGMIADFSIHDKGDTNPHAHIMLTTRNISRNGFGNKNRNWNKKENLLEWRKAWAHINNDMFKRKRLTQRIDHRTLKAQGLDQEPTIHLGHEAAALEKKGIKTERGDYNREIQRRNTEHTKKEAEIMELQKPEIDDPKKLTQKPEHINKLAPDPAPNEIITKLKTANRMNQLPQQQPPTPTTQPTKKPNIIQRVNHTKQLRKKYTRPIHDLHILTAERNINKNESLHLKLHSEEMDEHAKNAQTANQHIAVLEADFKNLHFWEIRRKQKLKKTIEQAKTDSRIANYHFKIKYRITPDQAPSEIKRIQKQIHILEFKIEKQTHQIARLSQEVDIAKREYLRQGHMVKRRSKQPRVLTSRRQSVSELIGKLREKTGKARGKAVKRIKSNKNKTF